MSRLGVLRRSLDRLAKALRTYRQPFRLLLWRMVGRRRFRIECAKTGLRFDCLRGADRMFPEVFELRLYEIPSLPVRAGDLVLDVGANHGFASCYFANKGADVLSFEPSRPVFELLERNIELNGLSRVVRARMKAVGPVDGMVELSEALELGGGLSSTIDDYPHRMGASRVERSQVQSVSLQSVFDDLGDRSVRLLKLDCEGAELEVLSSLSPALRERIDSIAVEYHAEAYPLVQFFELVVGWADWTISRPPETEFVNHVLHLARRGAIKRELARRAAGGPVPA